MTSPKGMIEVRLRIAPQRGKWWHWLRSCHRTPGTKSSGSSRAPVEGYVDTMMLVWFRKRREAEQRATERAERLIRDLGDGAYREARRGEREALDDNSAAHWRRVALAVARMTGKRVGLDTATRMIERGGE